MPPVSNPTKVAGAVCAIALVVIMDAALAANQVPDEEGVPDLTAMSVEQLVELDLTSITKTNGDSKHVAAAIHVVTNEDIRRIGATTIPEALRVVPGLHVARVDGNKWSVSVRGFSDQFVNKLLVLVDGRSVYTPLFSGTWWDQIDVMMEDIDRIEVISGPGASLWGANAVNGVINIITKKAKDTQGALVSSHFGNERYGGGLRYGADLGDDAYLKVFGRHAAHDDSTVAGDPSQNGDFGRLSKIGFRYDKTLDSGDKLTLDGDAYLGESGGAPLAFPVLTGNLTPTLTPPFSQMLPTGQDYYGNHILGRWERRQSADSSTVFRFYWDRHGRKANSIDGEYVIDTFDADFQHNYRLNDSHRLVWGSGFRFNNNEFGNGYYLALFPNQRSDRIYSLFAQDEITLVPERWSLTLGAKVEHNPVTQFEVQPNARLLWTPDEHNSVWASVSRSVRTPSWVEQYMAYSIALIPPQPAQPFPVLVGIQGNPNQTSEKMLAFETGWRRQWNRDFNTDISLYYYSYDDLQSTSFGNSIPYFAPSNPYLPQYVLMPSYFGNYGMAQVYGGEISADWQVSEAWKLRASYSYAEDYFNTPSSQPADTNIDGSGSYPINQAMLWSMYQITPEISLDLNWRFVDAANLAYSTPTKSYHEVDARLAWQFAKGVEFALVGRSLLDSRHYESHTAQFSSATSVQREVYGTFRWQF